MLITSAIKKCNLIYKGVCPCGSRYIGETKLNAEVRWREHNNPTKSSEPSKHLRRNTNHCFTWTVVSNAPKNAKTSKNMETVVLEMASHRAINDKMQTRKKEVHFFFFSVCYIVFNCTWQLRWLVGLKLIQLEQQKTQLPFIILAKNL